MLQWENLPKVHPPLCRNVFLIKAALEMVQEAVQLRFRWREGDRLAHLQNGWWLGLSLGKTLKWNRSVVCCPKFQIENKSPNFCEVFCPPLPCPLPCPTLYLHTSPWTNSVFAGVFLPLARTGHSQTFRLWTAHTPPWWLACSTSGQYDRYSHSVWRRTGTGQ